MSGPRVTPVRHGVDLVVHGGPERDRVGERVVEELDEVCARGLRLLREILAATFGPDHGEFDLLNIEVHSTEITLRFAWLDGGGSTEWDYTYFDVGYREPGPHQGDAFRPVRFEVGFW